MEDIGIDVYNTIFLYWENKKGRERSAYLDKCLATIKHHNHKVVIVTDKTITDYIPKGKINTKIWKLDAIAQRADYFRYLILHYNGGTWLDFDTICISNLSILNDLLNQYDIVFHSEAFFSARKGLFEDVITDLDNKLNRKNYKYRFRQLIKKILNSLSIFNFSEISLGYYPYKWAELGVGNLLKYFDSFNIYKLPNDTWEAKIEYNYQPRNIFKILSEDIKVEDFIHSNQMIIKLYNNGYDDNIKKKLSENDDTLFNKLIAHSLSK